jgi:hypothetical protein
MPVSSLRWYLLGMAAVLALAAHAQSFTWTYKGSWGSAELTVKPDGTVPTVYKEGHGTFHTQYTVDRIVGTMVYIKGASGEGFTANGWITPTHHEFKYYGREGGVVNLDGTNTAPQSMLDTAAALAPTPAKDVKDVVPGVKAEFFMSRSRDDMSNVLVLDKMKPDAIGCEDSVTIANFTDAFDYGVKYTGYVNVPKDDLYTFYTNSDDASMLFIDGTLVVENNGVHGAMEEPGVAKLAKGLHAITVYYYQLGTGAKPTMTFSYAGGGVEKTVVPASMLFRDKGDLKTLIVKDPIVTPTPAGPNGWIPSASANYFQVGNVLTGSGERWTTNRAMAPGDWLQIDLTKGYKLKSVTLDSAKSPSDAAHGVQLFLSQDGATFQKVAEKTAEECAGLGGLVKFTLPAGAAARYVKFVQTGSNGPSWWSVYNVAVETEEPKP